MCSRARPPTAPTNLGFSVDGDGKTVLSWRASTDNFGVAYYRICADGKFLTRCEYNEDTAAVIENAQSGTVYSITAYDAAGNVRRRRRQCISNRLSYGR